MCNYYIKLIESVTTPVMNMFLNQKIQKQPSTGILKKRCSENRQQNCRSVISIKLLYNCATLLKSRFCMGATLLKSHFGMGVLLQIYCIFLYFSLKHICRAASENEQCRTFQSLKSERRAHTLTCKLLGAPFKYLPYKNFFLHLAINILAKALP